MRNFLITIILLTSFGLHAQKFSSEEWHRGFVVTSNQDTVRGIVNYSMETNVVLVSRNKVVQTFSSQKLFYVEIYDKLVENYRQFYSIPYNVKYDYEVPILFEVLYEGPLSLLAREAIVTQSVNNSSSIYGGSYLQSVIEHTYYFLDKKGNIKMYAGRKADLYVIMANKQSHVKSFIKKNKLDVSDLRDLIRITAFYNSL